MRNGARIGHSLLSGRNMVELRIIESEYNSRMEKKFPT